MLSLSIPSGFHDPPLLNLYPLRDQPLSRPPRFPSSYSFFPRVLPLPSSLFNLNNFQNFLPPTQPSGLLFFFPSLCLAVSKQTASVSNSLFPPFFLLSFSRFRSFLCFNLAPTRSSSLYSLVSHENNSPDNDSTSPTRLFFALILARKARRTSRTKEAKFVGLLFDSRCRD